MVRPTTILGLTLSASGHYFGEVVSGLAREVTSAGGRIVLVQTLDPGAWTDELAELPSYSTPAAWDEIDGVVVIMAAVRPAYLQLLRDAGKPIVIASSQIEGFEAPLALPDNYDGTIAAVEHLIAHGHTRIGFVGNLVRTDVRERHGAYLQTLRNHGLTARPEDLFSSPENSDRGGAEAARAVLAGSSRPTALMVATDRAAIGLMRALTSAGLRIPTDIAVMGFDNIEASAFSTPTLSSVSQRFDEVGALAGRLVLAQIRGEEVASSAHSVPAGGIALRRSCGCAGAREGAPQLDQQAPPWPPGPATEQLTEVLAGALLTSDDGTQGPTLAGIHTLAEDVESLLTAGDVVPADRIDALAESLHQIAPDSAVLHRTLGALTEYLGRAVDGGSPGHGGPNPAAADRVSAALWRMRAGSFRRQSATFESALDEQVVVDQGLLEVGTSDPRLLGWLDGTHVRAAVLGLWEDGASSGRLRIEGSFNPENLLPELLGSSTTAEHFPPTPLVAIARPVDGEICIVVPVRTRDRDWGLLAVVGRIDTTSSRDTYHHWAALLCAALESSILQDTVRESEERYALAARATNDGLWEWDARTRGVYLSERCRALLGLEPGPDAGRLAQWQAVVHPEDLPEMRRGMRAATIGQRESVESEYRIRTADGSYRWVLARAFGVRTAGGPVQRVVGSLSDIHERRSLEDQLRENALYDSLTGLPNRRLFLDRLEHSVALWHRSKTPFAVLFLDLDRFKIINDSLGHQMGDRLLHEVGVRITRQLREVDTGARFGGDEFAILLHDVTSVDVLVIAQRVQDALAEMLDLDGHEFSIRASLGVATSAIEYGCAEDVLRDADTAMYHAKATERGTVSFFDAAMHAHAVQQLSLHTEIRHALDQNQFEVHYQPIVDLSSSQTDRFEALVRWRHPERGLVPPDDFLPLMEEAGLIVRLGHWIIDEVCRQLATWGPSVANVAVNVSDREFWHNGLLPYVLASLERYGLSADRLTIEITEGVIMRRPEVALGIMRDMHDAGLQLHIDDFGTGYSSLETLHRFPVDAFKIDRSFIRGLTSGDRKAELVRVIVAMGQALGLAVVAEGVETAEQLDFLREIGCATGQGFLFTPAVHGDLAGDLVGRVLGASQLTVAEIASA